jgi:chromosomal replication initiation ATPase DnaA
VTDPLFPLNPEIVLKTVADAYHVSVKDLKHRQSKPAPEARLAAILLLHDDCRLSWVTVAEVLGRQHGSATTFSRKAKLANPDVVEALRHRLYNGNQGSLW